MVISSDNYLGAFMKISFLFIVGFIIISDSTNAEVSFDIITDEISINLKDGKIVKFKSSDYQSAFNIINELEDGDDKNAALKIVLQNYPLPTPEEILTAALVVKDQALQIVNSKNQSDCNEKKEEEVRKRVVENENENGKKCYICSLVKNTETSDYKIMVGKIFHPNEVSLSIVAANDQPFHGALESVYEVGDDVNGHTYGSKLNLEAVYDWGSFTMDAGTDLYVLSYDKPENKSKHYYTDTSPKKVLQEAAEHSYIHLGTRINLTGSYLRFKMGYEVDSDQGIGKLGAISHREAWHAMGGNRENEYVNHMSDRKELTGAFNLGKEFYQSIAGLGFCAIVEGGASASTTGRLSVGGEVKAQINSGNYLGGSRNRPMVAVSFAAGFSNPVIEGKNPSIEIDSRYSSYLTNRNYSMVEDLQSSYAAAGVEIGGKKLTFGIDAVFEKNSWSDGDILYVTTLKYKFK